MMAPAIVAPAIVMVQGCASDVGKSLVVAGLCRLLRRRGISVAPFKAVSIALNSGVSVEGLEMARAQILQAWAAGTEPEVAMNPVLIKPEGAGVAQLVVRGRPRGRIIEGSGGHRREAWTAIRRCLNELVQRYQAVVIEGSGSAVEPNLQRKDLANMRVARLARAPVVLVGDIERGGVFAAMTGTLGWLAPADRARVRALLINRHHGSPLALASAIAALRRRTRKPVLGVLPHIQGLRLSEEDSLHPSQDHESRVDVAVVRLKHMSNFTDFEPLSRDPRARVRFIDRPEDLGNAQIVVLPGTKATLPDLQALRRSGLDAALTAAARAGVLIFGICGGFQMLGERLLDPLGIEGGGAARGLGLLPVRTRLLAEKTTRLARGTARLGSRTVPISGYEIHMGRTRLARGAVPFARLEDDGRTRFDGAVAHCGTVMGTYLHGIFDEPPFRKWFLQRAGQGLRQRPRPTTYRQQQETDLDRLADVMERHLDLRAVWQLMRLDLR